MRDKKSPNFRTCKIYAGLRLSVQDYEYGDCVAVVNQVIENDNRTQDKYWIVWTLHGDKVNPASNIYQQGINSFREYLIESKARIHWTVNA